jgi:hypothetical protein
VGALAKAGAPLVFERRIGSRPPRLGQVMKRCTKCGAEKPPVAFRRDRSRKDGRYPQCRACEKEWREANAERLKAYHRAWNRTNPEKKRAHDRRYWERKAEDPCYRERRRANARRRNRERRAQDPEYRDRRRAN